MSLAIILAFIAGNVDKNAVLSHLFITVRNLNSQVSERLMQHRMRLSTSQNPFWSIQRILLLLKAQRPQTYEAITNALSKVTDAQVTQDHECL